MELLCCFKIIVDVASLAKWKFLLYYLLSEQFPSITISYFFNVGGPSEQSDTLNEIEGLYSSQSKDITTKVKARRHHRTDASPAGSDYHNLAVNEIY